MLGQKSSSAEAVDNPFKPGRNGHFAGIAYLGVFDKNIVNGEACDKRDDVYAYCSDDDSNNTEHKVLFGAHHKFTDKFFVDFSVFCFFCLFHDVSPIIREYAVQ